MIPRSLRVPLLLLCASAAHLLAQAPAAPKPPIVNDPALRIELVASSPDVEACTTVCSAPDGSIYVGNDPRDGRLSTSQPVNQIIRFSSMGADKKRTVFADKIYSPAGSAWHDGYLYVLHDPLLTRFRDTDGDGIADVREDLVTNLGIPPNEGLNDHVVSGFTLGMDGFFYISVGDRGIFQAKSVKDGSTISMRGGGIARCRTDGTQLEVFSTGTRNHLQVNLDAEDNAFTRDNTDDGNGWWTRLTHHIEGGYYGYPYDYRSAPNYGVVQPSEQTLAAIKQHGGNDQWKMANDQASGVARPASSIGHSPLVIGHFLPAMADFGGGSPTGGLCYLSDGLPEKYRGKHFFSEWGKAGVFVTEVARDGATFRLVSDTKLIEVGAKSAAGTDFRPMQLSVAADGSLLIADWGYGGWKSPRVAGAIWRLSWPEAKIAPRLKDESKATIEELLTALGHPDRDQRLRAEAALVMKGEGVVKKLAAAAKNERAPTLQRIHALWTLARLAPATPSLQPGGLADISRGSSAATTPGITTPSIRPGGAAEANATALSSPAPAGADSAANGKPRVSPGANVPQPSGLAAKSDARSAVIAVLASALESKTPAVRAQAARALGELHAPALDMLVERFRDSTSEVRLAIVTALTRLGPIPGAGLNVAEGLNDPDAWVRFSVRRMIQEHGEWGLIAVALADPTDPLYEAAWLTATHGFDSMWIDPFPYFRNASPPTRARVTAALGGIAFRPKPYDGHWWGTQPVKNPPPLNSVPWAGTPAALVALTAALSDPDAGVRMAAALAFSQFILSNPEPERPPMAKNAQPTSGNPDSSVRGVDKKSLEGVQTATGASPTASGGLPTSPGNPPTPTGGAPTVTGTIPTAPGGTPTTPGGVPTIPGGSPSISGALPTSSGASRGSLGASPAPSGAAPVAPTLSPAASGAFRSVPEASRRASGDSPLAPGTSLGTSGASPVAVSAPPSLSDAVQASRAALRGRLTAEPDRGVRRQIIEALGVQKDPQAMEVFRQIALDEKADAEFRDTAIGAVVSIGGDGAKKVIAQLAAAQLSPTATRTIIKAAGELKVIEAAPALIAHLKDEEAGHRELAARSLQQLGPKSAAGPALIEAMADKDGKVQAAAVDALGSYREKAALPGIIALLEKKKHLRETTGALVLMPDESAIPVLVETLRDRNTTFRRNAIKALKTMREKAWPQVEALLASGRMPEELVPEIRNAFDSGAIVKWKMVGVFENVWEAVHPPEKEMLSLATDEHGLNTDGRRAEAAASVTHPWKSVAEILARKYHNAEGKDVGWIDVTADATEGRVDLGKVFQTTAMVCAYAFAEIDAPEAAAAKLFTSADDEIGVWLNGQRIVNQPGNHGYEPDKNETPIQLKAGKNALFVKIGNKGGSWVFHARIPGFENGKFIPSKEPTPEEKQKAFALAAKPDGSLVNAGDAKRGEKLFFDPAGALGGICATCHAVGAKGGQIGPALTTVGANYKRADLITSLHEPSKTIALGFEQVMLETNGGETIAGSLRAESADAFTIVDAAGQSRAVKKAEVKKKTDLHVSLMPPGLTLSLKPEDFADLLAYLESLKGQ